MRRLLLIAVVLLAAVGVAAGVLAVAGHRRGPTSASCRTARQDSTAAIRDAGAILRRPLVDKRGLTGAALAKASWKAGTAGYDQAFRAREGEAASRARFGANMVREDATCFTVRERARADTQLGILDSSRGR